jgi:hypothetical protein
VAAAFLPAACRSAFVCAMFSYLLVVFWCWT